MEPNRKTWRKTPMAHHRKKCVDSIKRFPTKQAPQELFVARVVPSFNKGESDDSANYRPNSVLRSAYNIYMMIR